MPIYTAPLIHNGKQFLPKNSSIVVDANGVIVDVLQNEIPSDAIHLQGLLCPAFVNAHCHLELSYLHNCIPQKTGLVDFLMQVNAMRFQQKFTDAQIQTAMQVAQRQMLANGIIAVGDISNTSQSLNIKNLNILQYHTFVEIMGIVNENATERLEAGLQILKTFSQTQKASLVPHAPYSVSKKLFTLINNLPNNTPISIHNQECAAEDELIQNGTGNFLKLLESVLQKPFAPEAQNTSALQYYLQLLCNCKNILFVHNTFTNSADVLFAKQHVPNRFWVLCPNANLYIENKLPNIIDYLITQNENICLGTDSLASNNKLCIYAEMQTLNQHLPKIGTEKLLQFATHNGAKALNMEHLGNINKNNKPGILQISNWQNQHQMPEKPIINRIV